MAGPLITNATARVTFTVEVAVRDVFSAECSIGTLHEVASKKAREAVMAALDNGALPMSITGKPSVEITTARVLE